jgi:hypothetical protein
MYGVIVPELSHLQGLEDYRDTSAHVGCGKAAPGTTPQVAADTTVSVLLLEASLRAAPELRNDMDVSSARSTNCEDVGNPR